MRPRWCVLCAFVLVTFFFFSFLFPFWSQVFISSEGFVLQARAPERTDFEAVQQEVEISRMNRVGRGTKTNYSNNQRRYLQWLSVNRPDQLNREWVAAVFQDAKGRPLRARDPIPELDRGFNTALKTRLTDYDRNLSPLNYETFSLQDLLVYFQQLDVQATSKGPHRAAARALFEHYGQVVPADWDRETKEVFGGMKRREAQDRQDGVLVLPSGKGHRRGGKKPLTVQMYANMNSLMYKKQCKPFRVLFVILMWNLMARASNVDKICLNHIDWTGDAMTIMFCHMKNNQTGQGKGMHARHIYANPKNPACCPILALGVYLLTTEAQKEGKLFHSSREYSRVLKGMRDTLEEFEEEILETLGVSPEEWGLHSYRKGAGSYATNGPCAVHKSISDNRGGWTQGGQADTYYGFVPEGDQLIGRILALLPMDSVDFASLPPQFQGGVLQERVTEAFAVLLPTYVGRAIELEENRPQIKPRVLSFCLASVVYHSDWLLANLSAQHPLRATPLFTDVALLNSLKAIVSCKDAENQMQATGVPEVIVHLKAIDATKTSLLQLSSQVLQTNQELVRTSERIVSAVGEKIEAIGTKLLQELDERQLESHLTPTGMRGVAEKVFGDLFQQHSLHQLGEKLDNLANTLRQSSAGPHASPAEAGQQPAGERGVRMYAWGGKIRLLPENFVLPTAGHSPAMMWNLYIAGNDREGVPPLKEVGAVNCPKPYYKMYCEFLQLMSVIRQAVEKEDAWTDESTPQAAATMFEIGKSILDLPNVGPGGNRVRPDNRAWLTVWRNLSKEKKALAKPRARRAAARQAEDEMSESDSMPSGQEGLPDEDDDEDGPGSEAFDPRPARKRRK